MSGTGGVPRPDDAEPAAATPTARTLCDVRALTAYAPETAGVRWKLDPQGRQLDANVVRLPAGREVETHAEPDLDVLLLVVGGTGSLGTGEADGTAEAAEELADGSLCWLPRGSARRLSAGPDGLSYLTVHVRRPGMRIGRAPSSGA